MKTEEQIKEKIAELHKEKNKENNSNAIIIQLMIKIECLLWVLEAQ